METELFTKESTSQQKNLRNKILELKRDKNAIVLAHYYQVPEIQDVADYVGDSLGLAQQAAATDADLIVFSGVYFMAETAKLLNPKKKVVVPDLNAGCSLADSVAPEQFRKFINDHPNHRVLTYINCSAEVKAMSDLICTSSNAEQIVRSIPIDQQILFAPDINLGKYLIKKTGRPMLLWNGACVVHESFAIEKLLQLHRQHPDAKIIAHPEAEEHILKVANYVGSTAGMIRYVSKDNYSKYIVATEVGILREMSKAAPHKTFLPAPTHEDNTCGCSECGFMKMNSLEKLYDCLENERPEVTLSDEIQTDALPPLLRMLELSIN
jgi:quinolinate synthase